MKRNLYRRELLRRKKGGDRHKTMYQTRRMYTLIPHAQQASLGGRVVGKRRAA